jgi:hypothetical protein
MQRIRKDSETLSSPGVSTTSRARRETDRSRSEILAADGAGLRNPPTIREVKSITIQ